MKLSILLGVTGLSLASSALREHADSHSLIQEAVVPRHDTPASKLLEQVPASKVEKEDEKNVHGPADLGVGLQPIFIATVALVFSCLLGMMCCFVPRLEGVTLGIAGTIEERWKQPG